MIIPVTNSRKQLNPVPMTLARMGSGFACVPATTTANPERDSRLTLWRPGSSRKRTEPAGSCALREPVPQLLCICVFPLRYPPLLGHRFGAIPSPCGARSSASLRALQVPVPPQKIHSNGKERRANLFGFPPGKQTFGTWEPGPLPRLRQVCPKQIRELKTENKTCI
jgi:hypothetical protein